LPLTVQSGGKNKVVAGIETNRASIARLIQSKVLLY
jgi:hypothetical protein